MTLTLHRSPRVDLLADGLADRLATPPDDPFATDLVIVPAKGVERWLSQRLSHRLGTTGGRSDGVTANVDFRAPRSLVAEIVGGRDAQDGDDPWRPDALVWPLLGVIDDAMGEPWARALTRHLGRSGLHGDDLRRGRRWAVAHRLARLFAGYAAQRPALLADWEAGRDSDGGGGSVDPDLAWQPELWRRVVGRHGGQPSPGERHRRARERLVEDPAAVDLPQRVSLFGHTRLTVTEVDLLQALSRHRVVDIWLPHPSDALWQALRDPSAAGPVPRVDDDSHLAAAHPLLATFGRDVRELQRTLAPVAAQALALDVPVTRPATLLGRLQAEIEANQNPAGDLDLAPDDRSVQVHACHGAARQVEVLREVVLGLLADDPTLEPRDVVVMCPDIERYAPLVEAAFGLGGVIGRDTGDWHAGHRLDVRLADRSLAQTNPVLDVLGRLLDLADGRVDATSVLDLAATEPVRRRFGFTDDDLAELSRWVADTGVRWAFDAPHRAPFRLEEYVQNTWQFGLDRVLAGVAVSDDARRWFGPTLPYDAVGSADIDLAGRVAELLDRLRAFADQLQGEHAVGAWVELLRDALGSLTATPWGEEWQLHQAERELAAIGAEQADDSLRLRLADVRSLLTSRLVGRPTRANFRTGSLTVCTMVPMRSVPHRVVCLLGLDDGVFPRAGAPDGDDVLARHPVTGERDPRGEDRQLLLDAILAARDHLVVTYAGADEVTGRPRPPAVPLGELVDALDATAPGAARQVVVHHPLQPFDRRNFVPGALGTSTPFSFDAAGRAAAVAARGPRRPAASVADLELPPAPRDDVDLGALGAFLRTPVKEFWRRRLGVSVHAIDESVDDAIPIELDGLQEWAIGSRLLADRIAGRAADEALATAWRQGDLPPGRLGWAAARGIAAKAEPLAEKARLVVGEVSPSSVDVDVDLGEGRRLRGTVPGVHGDRVLTVSYSRSGARHHLDAWVPLLALAAARPDVRWTSGTISRGRDGADLVVFDAIEPDVALGHLRDLVALRDLGLTRPLCLPLKTGFSLVRYGEDSARRSWNGSRDFPGERAKDQHPEVWGPDADFGVLRAAPAGMTIDDLAPRLWRPVVEAASDR